jgi:hypothetical protein
MLSIGKDIERAPELVDGEKLLAPAGKRTMDVPKCKA